LDRNSGFSKKEIAAAESEAEMKKKSVNPIDSFFHILRSPDSCSAFRFF
jgi:hypothetical protein